MRRTWTVLWPAVGLILAALSGGRAPAAGTVPAAVSDPAPDLVLVGTGGVTGEIDLCG